MSKLIIGLGSGRCGTMSLAHLLDSQPDSHVTHEACPLPWVFYKEAWDFMSSRLLSRDADIIGDVGYYWINYVDALLELSPQAKFLCLKRPRDEVIESMWNYSRGLNVHPINKWYRMYPYYDTDRKTAIGLMWDEYYTIAEKLSRDHSGVFRIVDMGDLNTTDGVGAILDFAGIPSECKVVKVGIRANAWEDPTK